MNHSKIIVTESSSYPKESIYHDGGDDIKVLEKSFDETSQVARYVSGTDDIIDLDKYIGRILFDNDLNYHDDSTLISRGPNIVLGFATELCAYTKPLPLRNKAAIQDRIQARNQIGISDFIVKSHYSHSNTIYRANATPFDQDQIMQIMKQV